MAALGGALAWPIEVRAQADLPRVAVLMTPGENEPEAQARVAAFRDSLRKLGWIDGQDLRLDLLWGNGDGARIKGLALDLVQREPRVIVANGTPAVAALSNATRTIPVVFALVMDPVGLGYIDSFARPGHNITGFTFIDFSLVGKWLDVLKNIAPITNRSALIYNPDTTPYWANYLRSEEASSVSKTMRLIGTPVRSLAALESAIAEMARAPGGSLMFPPDPFNVVHSERSARRSLEFGLPTISVYRSFAELGGLAAYGPDTADIFRRAASYVDRILKGEGASALPAQNPDRFNFVINLKTAKTLGLTVPPMLLAEAAEVIE
jgi:putative ABC transport system substrate-binding protein